VASREGAEIEARLRVALVPPDQLLGREGVDMSPAAVTARLREAAEMSSLCLALALADARAPG
jgi:hypothetical protein